MYNNIISDTQNLYVDEDDNRFYVASNSLPSGGSGHKYLNNINVGIKSVSIPSDHSNEFGLVEPVSGTPRFSAIKFNVIEVPFRSGDEVYYESSSPYGGLESGATYFVEVDINDKKIIK